MSIPEITPQEAKARLDRNNGTVYLDVRTVGEFDEGRPPGAINIPIMVRDPATGQMMPNDHFLDDVLSHLPKDAEIIAGCRSGGRSARATAVLLNAGYNNVVNMEGGFGGGHGPGGSAAQPGWSTLHYPIEKGPAGERSYEALRSK